MVDCRERVMKLGTIVRIILEVFHSIEELLFQLHIIFILRYYELVALQTQLLGRPWYPKRRQPLGQGRRLKIDALCKQERDNLPLTVNTYFVKTFRSKNGSKLL